MKVKELLVRRVHLQEQKERVLLEIAEMTKDLGEKDLQLFIQTGDASQVNGHDLDKLQRQRVHLNNLRGSLDREILLTSRKEKEKAKGRMERKVKELTRARGRLAERVRYLLEKTEVIREESRGLKTEETELRSQLNLKENPTKEFVFRLNLMEEFLQDTIVLGDGEEKISEEVLKAREHNQKILAKPRIGIDDTFFRNFKVEQDTETLEILRFELSEQSAGNCLRNLDRKDSLTTTDFVREVC